MNPTTSNLGGASTAELLLQFADAAKIARTAMTPRRGIPANTPERRQLVQNLQALGAEIRARRPIQEVRKLLDHENLDVRGWAAAQFLSLHPEWAEASLSGLLSELTTAETLALTRRVRQRPPKRPPINELSSSTLVERFEDAATREYATRFLDCTGERADMALRNSIVREVTDIMRELKSRGQLALLVTCLRARVSPFVASRRLHVSR
jgi:hypothetical protein